MKCPFCSSKEPDRAAENFNRLCDPHRAVSAITQAAATSAEISARTDIPQALTATLALSSTDANNEITFAYETRANVTFVLKYDTGNDIQVINCKVDESYSVADGEKLNLTASVRKFNASNKDN